MKPLWKPKKKEKVRNAEYRGIPWYTEKALYLMRKQNFRCAIAATFDKKIDAKDKGEVHHRLHNTKPNRKRFPLFINSVFNLWLVNHDWHMMYPAAGKIDLLLAEQIESLLEENDRLNEWSQRPVVTIPYEIMKPVANVYFLIDEEVYGASI